MTLNQPFTTTSNVIATYDGTNLATGIGVGIYYLADSINTSVFLTTASDTYSFTGSIDNSVAAIDGDFDITLGQSFNIEGDTLISIPIQEISNAGAHTKALGVKLRKYDGTTETDIVTDSENITLTNLEFKVATFKLTTPRTHFGVGDVLRVTVTLAASAGGGFGKMKIFYDPSNLNTTATILTTQARLKLPILIDM